MKVKTVFTSFGQRWAGVACAAALGGVCSMQAATFDTVPGPVDDPPVSSMGVVKITVAPKFRSMMTAYPGFFADGRLYSPVVIDNNTTIGRSATHANGVAGPQPVGALLTPVQYSDYPGAGVPPDFVGPPAVTREVFTEIRRMVLMTTGRNGCPSNGVPPYTDPRLPGSLPAGIPLVSAGPGSGVAGLTKSIGQVQSKTPNGGPAADFGAGGARSFFDVFVEVNLPSGIPYSSAFPGATLRNSQPLVVTNQILTSFPPAVIYIHGGTTAAALQFTSAGSAGATTWAAGETFGWIVLAGHGTALDCSNPSVVQQFVNAVLGPPTGERADIPLPPGSLTPIPTLSQWGLIILGLLLLTCGTVFIMRRRVPAPTSN